MTHETTEVCFGTLSGDRVSTCQEGCHDLRPSESNFDQASLHFKRTAGIAMPLELCQLYRLQRPTLLSLPSVLSSSIPTKQTPRTSPDFFGSETRTRVVEELCCLDMSIAQAASHELPHHGCCGLKLGSSTRQFPPVGFMDHQTKFVAFEQERDVRVYVHQSKSILTILEMLTYLSNPTTGPLFYT